MSSTIMMLEGLESTPSEHLNRAWYKIKALRGMRFVTSKPARDQYHTLMLAKDLLSGAHAHLASIKEAEFNANPTAKGLVDEFNEENERFGKAVLVFEQSFLR